MSAEYGADQIQILEGLEAVRKRPGMYIGSTSSRGLHHLVYEIVDNAVDEALAGYCDRIDVTIHEDNSITVLDDGRGIPVGIQKKAGIPAVEVVFTILHAGGKFGGGGYKVSGGLHGVGASVVNALSTWLEVRVYQDGKIYQQRYERGKVMYPLKVVGECPADKHGTEVHFLPDPEVFEETVYDFEVLRIRLQETAFLTKALKITLRDEREERGHVLPHAGHAHHVLAACLKDRVERAEMIQQRVRELVDIAPRHGVKQQQLEHAVVIEIIEPIAHEARLHTGAVAVMHAHKTAPRRSPYWPRR